MGKENPGTPFVIMQKRYFEVLIYEEDYKEMCAHVLRKPNIETGGDLFGLWQDERKAVVQLALGPGKRCRRTSTSFYQDVEYLDKVGSYLTQKEGVCHIGEWHSHHQLGLARPSGGDESTVWRNMPTYQLSRFVIFIANIEATGQSYKVNIGCFLFEIDRRGTQLPVKQGRFKILPSKNPFWLKNDIGWQRKDGAENSNGDMFDVNIADLKLERGDKSPSVTLQRPRNKRYNSCEYDYDTPPCKKGNNVNYGSRAPGSNKHPERNGRSQTHHQVKDVHQQQNRDENYAPDHDKSEMQEDETTNASKSLRGGKQEKNERGGIVERAIITGGTEQCVKKGESSDSSKVIQKNNLGKAEISDEGQHKEDDGSRGPSLLQDKGEEEGRIRDEEQQDVKKTDQNKDGVKDENKEGPVEEGSKTDDPDLQKNETGCPSPVISHPQADQQHEMVPKDQNKIGNDEKDSAKEDKMGTAEGQDKGENIKDQDHSTKASSQDQNKDMKGDSKKVKENKVPGKKPDTQVNPRPGVSKGKTSKEEKKISTEKDKVGGETSKGVADKAKGEPVLKKTGTGTTSEKKNGATKPKSTSKKTTPSSKASTKKKYQ